MRRWRVRAWRAWGGWTGRPVVPKDHYDWFGWLSRWFHEAKGDGNIVEVGVGHGHSFLMLAALVYPARLMGFDAFRTAPQGLRPHRRSNPDAIRCCLRRAGFDPLWVATQVSLFEGDIRTIQVPAWLAPIRLLHLDVDLTLSYHNALIRLLPFMDPRGIVVIDEYDDPRWPGVREIIDSRLTVVGRQGQRAAARLR